MPELGKVLVIDDNPKFLEDSLPLYGYEVESAVDGLKAMKTLSKKTDFDIILLDVMMPNMNGWDVLKEIREILTQEQNNELDNLRNRYNNYLDAIGW